MNELVMCKYDNFFVKKSGYLGNPYFGILWYN